MNEWMNAASMVVKNIKWNMRMTTRKEGGKKQMMDCDNFWFADDSKNLPVIKRSRWIKLFLTRWKSFLKVKKLHMAIKIVKQLRSQHFFLLLTQVSHPCS